MKECFNSKFIQEFYKKKIRKFIFSKFYYINMLLPKKNEILAYIDYEKINDTYMPYRSDNVYILCEDIKKHNQNIRVIYAPSTQFGGKTGSYIGIKKKLFFMWKRLTSKIIIFKQPPHISEYFTKKQHLICLGYFIPFKADYWDFAKWWVFYANIFVKNANYQKCDKYRKQVLEHFTYVPTQFEKTNMVYITASKYASKAIARSHNLPLENFLELGSLKSEKNNFKKVDISKIFQVNDYEKIIIYAPTFRDKYIRVDIKEIDKYDLNIFGYKNEKEELEEFLVENKILMIIKLHKSFPFYRELEKKFIKEDKSYFKNCYFLDFEMEAEHNISVYDLFESSDAMIADYSSISFDYLAYDKPIIYNIPDIEEYRGYRGFSYEPIEEMMSGERVQTIEQFKEALLNIVNSKDDFKEKRSQVLAKVNEVPQGEALSNIYKYVNSIIKGSSNAK